MTRTNPTNHHPNEGPFDQPVTRLDELLADRAVQGLTESEAIELRRLLTTAGKAEDSSLDLAAAASMSALYPHDQHIEVPASLLAALDREGEAWCGGVQSCDQVAGRIHERSGRLTDVGQGRLFRTPFKRFTREYGGWIAAAACLCFGVYAIGTRGAAAPSDSNSANIASSLTKPIETIARPLEDVALGLRQRAVERLNRWFNNHQAPDIVPLGTASPDAGPDVAVGEVMWNAEEGTGVLRIKGVEDAKIGENRTYRVNVLCAKTGKRIPIETGTVTFHRGQKDVLVPLDSPPGGREIHDGSAFVVSVCSQGPMGVSQSEGIVGIGGSVESLNRAQSEPESN
jgi:hypothetical protein